MAFNRKVSDEDVTSPTPSSSKKKTSSPPPWSRNTRTYLVLSLIGLLFAIAIARIFWLTFSEESFNQTLGNQKRGFILDADRATLAFSEERYNIYLNGKNASLSPVQISNLAHAFRNQENVIRRIDRSLRNKNVLLLKRYLPKDQGEEIIRLGLPAVLVDKVQYRFYPYHNLLSQTIGFVGHEGNGFYGLEYKYNQFFNFDGEHGLEKKLVLNIDINFQRKLEELIEQSVIENHALYGNILVQEIKTGRLIAIANYPSFDLNQFGNYPQESYVNQGITYLVEPGSIFKIFYAAYIMEKYNFSSSDLSEKRYHCLGYYELSNGERIKCHDTHGDISLEEIIKYSCNSGIIQATEELSPQEMFDFLLRFRIGQSHESDLPNETKGLILPLKDWGIRTKATIPLGQGLAISPLHLINIFSALIGDGFLFSPKVVRYKESYQNGELIEQEEVVPEILNKIVSKDISKKVVDLLQFGTIKGSTGYSSRQSGFEQVFGKTATSQLANITSGGYYTNRYHSMFAGGYPVEDPQYSILVVVSQPKKEYYGGKVAAPIFSKVVAELNQSYGLTTEREVEEYRNFILEDQAGDEFIVDNLHEKVPDFSNMSIRSAVVLLEDLKKIHSDNDVVVNYQINGSGFVNKQTPRPGTPIKNNLKIVLHFK